MARLTIVGIGARPLPERAKQALSAAEIVVGTGRACAVFSGYPEFEEAKARIRQIDGIGSIMASIREAFEKGGERIVLLASGDPFFFGIGRRAVLELGRENVEVIPDVSSVQLAFSKIGIPWDDALLVSLHGADAGREKKRPYGLADLPGLLGDHATIALLTDEKHGPAAIARALRPAWAVWPSLVLHVCENLGIAEERITEGSADEIAAMSFSEPNIVIVTRAGDRPAAAGATARPRFGLREEEIAHSGGLITKEEVRAVTIHALRLPEEGVFWDIGAGSGAVSVEAARLCPRLQVFAVEKDVGQLDGVRKNKVLFGLPAIETVEGEAPFALSALPDPDRVFVGGSGGRLKEIIEAVKSRMGKGIVVINAATLETLNEALAGLERGDFRVRVSEVSVARARPVGEKRLMAAFNPVFVISGERE